MACRFEIVQDVLAQAGATFIAAHAMLTCSPIIQRLEHGLYARRGRRIGSGALDAARARMQKKMGEQLDEMLASRSFLVRVTDAALRHEQHNVPAVLHDALRGRLWPLLDAQGRRLGTARVGERGALRGINEHFPEARPGDLYRIRIESDALSVAWLAQQAGVSTVLVRDEESDEDDSDGSFQNEGEGEREELVSNFEAVEGIEETDGAPDGQIPLGFAPPRVR